MANRPAGKTPGPQGARKSPPQPQKSASSPPGKGSARERDLAPDTVWHTRGAAAHGGSHMPSTARTARKALPPSKVPRMLLWALLLALALFAANMLLRTHSL